MSGVAIIADSVACLSREMVDRYAIRMVPLYLLFEGKSYRDWLDISSSEAYRLLEMAPKTFNTSPASPTDYLEAYRELSTQAENILCITLSSKLSTLYNMAQAAKEQAKTELPHVAIELFDSGTVTAAEGFVVLAAARAAAEGKGLTEVIKAAEEVRGKVGLIILMDTIRHVYRTGRIPKVAAQLGSMLQIKPMITIKEGVVHFVTMARNKQRGINRLLEVMREQVDAKPVHVAVMHADTLEEGEKLKQMVSTEFNCVELWLTEFSPIMGYATGRGVLGLAFYAED